MLEMLHDIGSPGLVLLKNSSCALGRSAHFFFRNLSLPSHFKVAEVQVKVVKNVSNMTNRSCFFVEPFEHSRPINI